MKRRKIISKEEKINFKSDYEAGMSSSEIGRKYGYHPSTIRRSLISIGVVMRNGAFIAKIDLPVDQIISERQSGMSVLQIAVKHGVGETTIRDRIKKNLKDSISQIWFDYESGLSEKDLADKYGSTERAIHTHLKELEIK